MSRLLFAAARGARIERAHFIAPSDWEPSRLVWVVTQNESDYTYRIHPDDEHLQYGPISSALRDDAKYTNTHQTLEYETVGGEWLVPMNDWLDYDDVGELHRSLFLLILAEALADEGL